MEKFRIIRATVLCGLTAIVVTGIGIDHILAGGDGVSIGVRVLIAAAFIWLFVFGGIFALFHAEPAETAESVNSNESQPDATLSQVTDPPERLA